MKTEGILAMMPVLGLPVVAVAQPYTLPPLPYATDALEPLIDRATMEIHHGRHHQGYVDNLNAALKEVPPEEAANLEGLLATVSKRSEAIRNHGGGHYNHSLFWRLMAPQGTGGAPDAALVQALTRDFGDLEAFRKKFSEAAARRFGSGWAWLIVTPDKKLAVTSTPNQDNPLMDVVAERGVPILALDVWEHAYYLKYQNRRGDYVSNWWNVVNWNEVNRRFAAATR